MGLCSILSFYVWILSLMSSRSVHIAACVKISFLFKAQLYFTVWVDLIVFIPHPWMDT